MTVKELKEYLSDMPDNLKIILAKDGEGNDYSPLSDLQDEMNYIPESTWNGYVKHPVLTPELEGQGYTEEDISSEGEPALILWPTN